MHSLSLIGVHHGINNARFGYVGYCRAARYLSLNVHFEKSLDG